MRYSKITISGLVCSGKSTLFLDLQKKLSWPTFSTSQYFRNYALTNHASLEKAEEQNEKLTKEVDYRVREMLKKPDHLITEGWMTGIMAQGLPDILKVLLTCDDSIRFQRFAQRENISLFEAQKRIHDREKNLFDKLSLIYKRNDFLLSTHYDLVINTSQCSPDEIVQSVMKILMK